MLLTFWKNYLHFNYKHKKKLYKKVCMMNIFKQQQQQHPKYDRNNIETIKTM